MDCMYEYNDLKLAYSVEGEGDAVVMLHGWGCDKSIWKSSVEVLQSHFRVVAVDFAGFGRTILAYPDFARDILDNGALQKEKLCICCSKCTELMRAKQVSGCAIYNEYYKNLHSAPAE